jgi:hypothetical protein
MQTYQRKNIRFILDLVNAPSSTIGWVQVMLDEISETVSDVPDCDLVLTVTELEACDDNED